MGPIKPIAAGSARGCPATYTWRWAWMWYASCSIGAHCTPSTVAPWVVVEADARSGPCSSGIPSGPIEGWVEAVVVAVALALAVAVEAADELDELLPPHAASSAASAGRSMITSRRGVIRTANVAGLP